MYEYVHVYISRIKFKQHGNIMQVRADLMILKKLSCVNGYQKRLQQIQFEVIDILSSSNWPVKMQYLYQEDRSAVAVADYIAVQLHLPVPLVQTWCELSIPCLELFAGTHDSSSHFRSTFIRVFHVLF